MVPSINTVAFAEGAWEVRSRSEEEAMQRHRRRGATKRSPATPFRPGGCDGTPLSSVWLLFPDVPASPRRRAWNPGASRSQQTSSYLWK